MWWSAYPSLGLHPPCGGGRWRFGSCAWRAAGCFPHHMPRSSPPRPDPVAAAVTNRGWVSVVEHAAIDDPTWPYDGPFGKLQDAALLQQHVPETCVRAHRWCASRSRRRFHVPGLVPGSVRQRCSRRRYHVLSGRPSLPHAPRPVDGVGDGLVPSRLPPDPDKWPGRPCGSGARSRPMATVAGRFFDHAVRWAR